MNIPRYTGAVIGSMLAIKAGLAGTDMVRWDTPEDLITQDAIRNTQNTPSLVIDLEGQRKRYADKIIGFLKLSGYRVLRPNPLVPVLRFNGDKINVLDKLYPQDSLKSPPKSDWTNNPPKKRIPYFSGFRIGG